MKLRARWTGSPLPSVGDYLMSAMRPRFAYRICEVARIDRIVCWDPVLKTEFQYYTIAAERKLLGDVPENARVHPWRWDKREPRRKKAA
jgi:hypothetical protein